MNQTERQMALIDEAIKTEMNISTLYLLYSELFPEDRDFWWKLSIEEKNHAALLKSAHLYLKLGKLTDEVLYQRLETMKQVNSVILQHIEQYRKDKPSATQAYRYALGLENSAAELHFQQLMESFSEDRIVGIFQKLGGEDRNHAERVSTLISERGV